MEMMELKCTTCGVLISNNRMAVIFKCPNCGKETIVRCEHCRKIGAKYKCPSCGFEGP